MTSFMNAREYFDAVMQAPRPELPTLLAFYDHRIGAIVNDPRLMLIPLDDHLCHRGDGVFEVMKYRQRKIYQFDEHCARMEKSARAIRLSPPLPWNEVREKMLVVARAAASPEHPDGMIRVFMGRGPGGFGVDPAECPQASLYIAVTKFTPPSENWYRKGLSAFRTSVPARQEHIAQIKNTNYLPAVLMTQEARDKGCDVPLCFDSDGNLAESAVANVCLVDAQGRLLVPEFTHALPGTSIRRAIELLEGKIEGVIHRPIAEAEINAASEALLLGTTPDCASIISYEGRPVGNGKPGPVAAMLKKLMGEDLLLNGYAF